MQPVPTAEQLAAQAATARAILASPEDVLTLTGCETDVLAVARAQAIVEVAAGRVAAMVQRDDGRALLRLAVCWQVAYMAEDPRAVFEQANVESVRQDDTSIHFGKRFYALAPLALKAVQQVSWMRSRIINTPATSTGVAVLPEPWVTN